MKLLVSGNTHVHDGNTGRMELVHHILRGDTNCAYEERNLVLDENFSELWQLSFGIIILDHQTQTIVNGG